MKISYFDFQFLIYHLSNHLKQSTLHYFIDFKDAKSQVHMFACPQKTQASRKQLLGKHFADAEEQKVQRQ